MRLLVYHGGTEAVKTPLCDFGRAKFDFGKGFYVTDIKTQAVKWATLTAKRRNARVLVNVYSLDKEAFMAEANCKVFDSYDGEWLEFIVASRRGLRPWKDYDYIEGGVADDRVIDTVNLYMAGLLPSDIALGRLKMHKPNNQICLLNKLLTDKYLKYERTEVAE